MCLGLRRFGQKMEDVRDRLEVFGVPLMGVLIKNS